MLLVRGLPIGHPERSFVWQRQDVLQHLDLGDGLFGVQSTSICDARRHLSDSGLNRLHDRHLQTEKSPQSLGTAGFADGCPRMQFSIVLVGLLLLPRTTFRVRRESTFQSHESGWVLPSLDQVISDAVYLSLFHLKERR
jgi:hypothetical protein